MPDATVCAAKWRSAELRCGAAFCAYYKREAMPQWVSLLLLFLGYVVLMRFVLPRLGVGT